MKILLPLIAGLVLFCSCGENHKKLTACVVDDATVAAMFKKHKLEKPEYDPRVTSNKGKEYSMDDMEAEIGNKPCNAYIHLNPDVPDIADLSLSYTPPGGAHYVDYDMELFAAIVQTFDVKKMTFYKGEKLPGEQHAGQTDIVFTVEEQNGNMCYFDISDSHPIVPQTMSAKCDCTQKPDDCDKIFAKHKINDFSKMTMAPGDAGKQLDIKTYVANMDCEGDVTFDHTVSNSSQITLGSMSSEQHFVYYKVMLFQAILAKYPNTSFFFYKVYNNISHTDDIVFKAVSGTETIYFDISDSQPKK